MGKNIENRNILDSIAKIIRDERKYQGLSQTELAQLAGVSLNFISQLENGKPTVRLDKVDDVLKTLGLQMKVEYRNQ